MNWCKKNPSRSLTYHILPKGRVPKTHHQVLKRETSRVNPWAQVQTLEQELRGLRLSYEEHEHLRHLQMACQEDLWKNPLISSHTIYILVLNIYIYILNIIIYDIHILDARS